MGFLFKYLLKPSIFIWVILLFSCAEDIENSSIVTSDVLSEKHMLKLEKLKKKYVVGNFFGNGNIDTIFERNYSKRYNREIDFVPNPLQNEWDSLVSWFSQVDSDLYLTGKLNSQDTLQLGPALGLYSLINIGDCNKDGKDDIALVIDYLDESRLNSCKIFSFCKGKWTLLKSFQVNEDIFDVPSTNSQDSGFAYQEMKAGIDNQSANSILLIVINEYLAQDKLVNCEAE